jgi:hypothetical protein
MKINQIVEGWKNNLFPAEEMKGIIKLVSKERTNICKLCEFHSKHHLSIRPDAHCTNCGCTLSAKTKCLSCECPIGKWKAVLNEEEENKLNEL